MIAPALGDIQRDVRADAATTQVIMLITFLGFALGPFLFASLAETYGRRPVWVMGNVWFVLWNAVVPLGRVQGLMIFARLMAGVGASVDIAVSMSSSRLLPHR